MKDPLHLLNDSWKQSLVRNTPPPSKHQKKKHTIPKGPPVPSHLCFYLPLRTASTCTNHGSETCPYFQGKADTRSKLFTKFLANSWKQRFPTLSSVVSHDTAGQNDLVNTSRDLFLVAHGWQHTLLVSVGLRMAHRSYIWSNWKLSPKSRSCFWMLLWATLRPAEAKSVLLAWCNLEEASRSTW